MSDVDVAIVGAGIAGLAHAWEAARRGHSVAVFERDARPLGASIRNFGIILPTAMPPGKMLERGLRSRRQWTDLAARADFECRRPGLMIPVYDDAEAKVAAEFASEGPEYGYQAAFLEPDETLHRFAHIRREGLRGALWSDADRLIDPVDALNKITRYLAALPNVEMAYGRTVTRIEWPHLAVGRDRVRARWIIVCSGTDFETLYPERFRAAGLTRCKLQMMALRVPDETSDSWPMLATGLSMARYPSFGICPSVQQLREYFQQSDPEAVRNGIHVLVARRGASELVIGDSHEYGDAPDPFGNEEIDNLILSRIRTLLPQSSLDVTRRWLGTYAVLPQQNLYVDDPEPGVRIVSGLGGNGMTISFGLAQETLDALERAET